MPTLDLMNSNSKRPKVIGESDSRLTRKCFKGRPGAKPMLTSADMTDPTACSHLNINNSVERRETEEVYR